MAHLNLGCPEFYIQGNMKKEIIDLNTCEEGDILICSTGAKLEYVRKTEPGDYYDHLVKYIELPDGTRPRNSFGTRTNDGFVFRKNRRPGEDNDIIAIQRKQR